MDQLNPQLKSLADSLVNILSREEGVEASNMAYLLQFNNSFWVVDVKVACAMPIYFTENPEEAGWTYNTALGTLHDNDGNAFVFMFGNNTPKHGKGEFTLRIPMGRDGAAEMEWFREHVKLATQALAITLGTGEVWYVEKDVPTPLTLAELRAKESGEAVA